jgi:hypothetical protein
MSLKRTLVDSNLGQHYVCTQKKRNSLGTYQGNTSIIENTFLFSVKSDIIFIIIIVHLFVFLQLCAPAIYPCVYVVCVHYVVMYI